MYRILIADDEAEIRNGLCDFFPWKSIGFEVVGQAKNGQEAYELMQKHSVDVLLCDIIMPVLSGLELAKRLYSEKSAVRIVFMSAFTDFQYAKQAMEYGVRSYILKSMHYDNLIETFSKIKSELDVSLHIPEEQPMPLSYNEKIIAAIKKYVRENYARVTLEDVANVLHMNTDYISKFFKKFTGTTFSDYLTRVRMEKAAELLQDIQYKTYEISSLVGYSNQFNFTRAFKSYFGKSPREYRYDDSQAK